MAMAVEKAVMEVQDKQNKTFQEFDGDGERPHHDMGIRDDVEDGDGLSRSMAYADEGEILRHDESIEHDLQQLELEENVLGAIGMTPGMRMVHEDGIGDGIMGMESGRWGWRW